MSIKIVIPTDDGETVSGHFGQAKYFKVFTSEAQAVMSSEMRAKPSHQHGSHDHLAGVHPGQQMIELISDCQVLISGGMGTPALQRAAAAGLKVYLTRIPTIEAAMTAYLSGGLEHDLTLVHSH